MRDNDGDRWEQSFPPVTRRDADDLLADYVRLKREVAALRSQSQQWQAEAARHKGEIKMLRKQLEKFNGNP